MLQTGAAQVDAEPEKAVEFGLRRRRLASPRDNAASAALYLRNRRRDERHRLLPVPGARLWWIAAAFLAVVATIAAFLDAAAVPFHRSLPPAVLEAFGWLTEAGRSDWFLIPAGLILIAAMFARRPAKATRLTARRASLVATSAYVFLAVGLSGIVALSAKNIIGRARPKHFDAEGIWSFDPLGLDHSWTSFPSGHATTAGAVAMVVALLWPAYRVPGIALCALVAYSRVVIGAHYPSDIIAGFALGALLAWLIARAFARRRLVFAFDGNGRLRRRSLPRPAKADAS